MVRFDTAVTWPASVYSTLRLKLDGNGAITGGSSTHLSAVLRTPMRLSEWNYPERPEIESAKALATANWRATTHVPTQQTTLKGGPQ